MSSTSRQILLTKDYSSVVTNETSEAFALGASYNDFIGELRVTRTKGTATVKIQHSSDKNAWFDLMSFTAASTTTNELKEPTGKTLQYVRAIISTTTSDTVDLSVELYLNYRMVKG